ncbi:MAG TPA: hypothetical protein VGI39_06480 [Polyangiaceae bacterium]
MPLPFAWLVAFSLGAVFARVAKGEVARSEGPLVASRPMAVVLGFAGFVFLPIAGYFAAFHGDWAYLYFVNWQSVPSALDLALVLGAALLVPMGFVAGVGAVRSRRGGAGPIILSLIGVPLFVTLLLGLACAKRLAVSASGAQYAGGFGVEPIATSVLGKGVLWALVALAVGTGWAIRALRSPA